MRMTMDCFSHTFLLLFSSHLPSSRKRAKKRIRQEEKHSWHNTLRGQIQSSTPFLGKKNSRHCHSFVFPLFFQTGHTPLQRACAEGHLEAAKHLVSRGANVDHQDEVVRETIMIHFVHFIREIRELVYWYIISPFELLQQ